MNNEKKEYGKVNTFRLDKSEQERLDEFCRAYALDKSEIVRKGIQDFMNRYELKFTQKTLQ